MKRISSVIVLAALACSDDPTGAGKGSFRHGPNHVDAVANTVDEVGTAASANRFAVVASSGALMSGNMVTRTTWLGPGRYEITFNTDVSGCSYVSTTTNAYSQAIHSYTAGGHLSANGVYVETKNQGGGLTDVPFNLWVNCGGTNTPFAVIDYNAGLVRSSAGTTLTPLGSGRYNVRFNRSVSSCAFLATVGDPSNALVFYPWSVYTASGPNASTVYVETKNPGGGLQDGVPFHLSVDCPNASATRFVVMRGDGTRARQWPSLVSSVKLSTGNYQISSPANNAQCAKVATRGSIGTAVPFSPATVEITPGTALNNFGLQIRDLLFFGGALVNRQVHMAMIC
jgi:hypothetical protein